MKIVIDKQAKSNECDKTGCRNKAVKYVRLSGYGVNLCRKHAQQLLALDGGDSATSEQLSTPEVLSTLQGESTPTHRK